MRILPRYAQTNISHITPQPKRTKAQAQTLEVKNKIKFHIKRKNN
jgi:hypothetical protein